MDQLANLPDHRFLVLDANLVKRLQLMQVGSAIPQYTMLVKIQRANFGKLDQGKSDLLDFIFKIAGCASLN